MDFLLLLFLASSAVLVQGYGKSNDPNDEPFLPIYPVYPYSPKLIKRGTEKEAVAQLSAELYAPKVDAKDSYSASYSGRDSSYYPNYNSYPKLPSSPSYAFYGSLPYPNDPYTTPYNPYSYPLPSPSYSPPIPYSSSYSNYYYQSPYYPSYYNQPLFPPPPLPPPVVDYEADGGYPESEKNKGYRGKDGASQHQFVDGANYISGGSKDLDGQPTTAYKASGGGVQQNQLEEAGNVQMKHPPVPLPKTTYRVISVGGQPVGPDYPLPPSYARAQQLEELAATRGHHDWVKALARNFSPLDAKNVATNDDDRNDEGKEARYVPASIAKTGYVVTNPSVLRKVNVGRIVGKTRLKSVKYPAYATIEKPDKDRGESNEYENYESSSSRDNQDYDAALSSQTSEGKQQNYEEDEDQSSYQSQNYVTQTPSYGGYQYTSYGQPQTIVQRQTQQYKSNLDNANFGAKTKKA